MGSLWRSRDILVRLQINIVPVWWCMHLKMMFYTLGNATETLPLERIREQNLTVGWEILGRNGREGIIRVPICIRVGLLATWKVWVVQRVGVVTLIWVQYI